MRGIVFRGNRELEIMNFPDPTPGTGEVVIEIKASGMCGSDLKFYRAEGGASSLGLGELSGPVIAGHEPCGVVVAVGKGVEPQHVVLGARVMQHHYRGSGYCESCSTGWTQLCHDGVKEVYGATGHGAHAKYMKCPANTLVNLPQELSFIAGAAISCGTGTAWGAIKRLGLTGDQTIAIFGQGPVGLSATLLAAKMGARVIALDTAEQRLLRAKEFGAAELINPDSVDNVVDVIRDLTCGRGAHVSMDCSSSLVARQNAVKCLRVWGKACFVGEGGNITLDVSNDLLRRQISVIGSWTFSKIGQEKCARYIADKAVSLERLFTHTWDLENGEEAYKLFDKQVFGKAAIIPQ